MELLKRHDNKAHSREIEAVMEMEREKNKDKVNTSGPFREVTLCVCSALEDTQALIYFCTSMFKSLLGD